MRVALVPWLVLSLLIGCSAADDDDDSGSDDDTAATAEPLDLPDDPALSGVPVGVTTVEHDGITMEVWYPAPDAVAGQGGEAVDVREFVPAEVTDLLGDVELPLIETVAVRDAPLREPVEPYPVVVFSHGFGGFRTQSVEVTVHLASRGYVVVSADHPGRMLRDVLPCIFNPPLSTCDLETMMSGDDPAPAQVEILLAWVESAAVEEGGVFEGRLDLQHIGMTGHSAGGATTSRVGDSEERIDAILPMGGAAETARDVPALLLAGSCDAMFTMDRMEEVYGGLVAGQLVEILGAGHLAFTDLCTLDLAAFAEQVLEPRDDINTLFLDGLVQLAIDGCPGYLADPVPSDDCVDGYLPLQTSSPIVLHYATAFFDQQLRGSGPGVQPGVFVEAEVR